MPSRTITHEILANINEHIKSCKPTGLPPPRPGRVWALYDSGSAPHACPHKKLFDKTSLRQPSAGRSVYAAANGSNIINEGEFDLPHTTTEGTSRQIAFQHANIALPILSTGLLSDEDSETTCGKHGGHTMWLPGSKHDGNKDSIVRAMGEGYWQEMNVDEKLMTNSIPSGYIRRG